jgi:uncharacterized repeat protein (TIGR01451 family)
VLLVTLGALAAAPALASAAPTGALTQLLSPNDCISDQASVCGTTWPVANLGFSYQAIVSPDGHNVYWIANNDSLHEFARDPSTGALTALAPPNDCVTDAATGCGTVMAPGMGNPGALTISADGAYVYVATQSNSSIAEFFRNPVTGALSEIGCLSESDPNCTAGTITGMSNPYGITITHNGQNVYVSAVASASIAEFSRNTATGTLTQLPLPNACVTANTNTCGNGASIDPALNNAIGVNTSPDGSTVYVSAGGTSGGGDVDQFSVGAGGALTPLGCIGNTASGCAVSNALGLNGTEDLAFTPNGEFAYGNSFTDSDISEFSRNTSTGALTYQGCLGSALNTPPADNCSADVKGTAGALGVAVSPDGQSVYLSSAPGNSEAAFSVDPTTGLLTQLPAPNDCVATGTNGGCSVTTATGLTGARRVTVSPDGLDVYVAGQNDDSVVELARAPAPSDLTLSASGVPAGASVGATISATFTVTDTGPDGEGTVSFSDSLPANVSLVSAVTSTGASCIGTATVTCALGALAAGASDTVTVTVRANAAGTATQSATATGSTPDPNLANNAVSASTAVPAPTPTPTPTPLPAPVFRRTANLLPVSGTVRIELPHSRVFVPLTAAVQVPIGTIVDATRGRVTLVFALPGGKTETIVLYGGEFKIASQSASGLVTFVLIGPLHNALYSRVHGLLLARSVLFAPIKDLFAHAHHPKTVKTRSLWGSDHHGSFTTQGSDGAANVRGTVWLSEDFVGYSRFYVATGSVTVTDFRHHHRKIKLTAGHCYQTSTPKHCTPSPFERSGG